MTKLETQIDGEPEVVDALHPGARFMVLEYGLLPPTHNADLVFDQMRKATVYRAQLQRLEEERRDQYRAITLAHGDVAEISEKLKQVVEDLEKQREQIRLTRQATRSRSDSPEARAAVRVLADQAKALRLQLKEVRRQIATDPIIKAQIEAADAAVLVRVKEARASCGVYWGTYLLQEQAADQAKKASKLRPIYPFRGEGRVSVQIQKGCPVGQVDEDNRLIQVVARPPRDPAARSAAPASAGRRSGRERLLRLRVQSDGRDPVWAEWPMLLHRPLPPGGIIKVATVLRRRRGPFWDWRLLLTMDVTQCEPRREVPDHGTVALNLGFARRPDGGLRAGYLLGADGWQTEVLCAKSDLYRRVCGQGGEAPDWASGRSWSPLEAGPTVVTWIEQSLRKADSIHGFRDQLLDALRAQLCAWRTAQADSLPPWFVEWTEHMAWWRAPGRFVALRRAWQSSWFAAGQDGYDMIDNWFKRDMHLFRYETGMRSSALRDRKEGYRILAAWLAQRYRILLVDDTDLRSFARSPREESEEAEIDAVKWQQRVAAGSELRAALVGAFGPGRVREQASRDVTRLHAACGRMMKGMEQDRMVTCECGVRVDQDYNACFNLLRVDAGTEPSAPVAAATPGRAARLQAAAKAKRAAAAAEIAA